jgi:GDP-D-mannose 3',5'-epimerase
VVLGEEGMNMIKKKSALVLGAGGFIGHHLVKRLVNEGYWVRGVDLKYPQFERTAAHHFVIANLRDRALMKQVLTYAGCNRDPYQYFFALRFNDSFEEVYQLAADMGGAGFVFTGENDADIMHNSATINLNLLDCISNFADAKYQKIFYSSSACIYPEHNQLDPNNPLCAEDSAYPANPDSEYGWEKLFSERLYFAYARNYELDVRVARFHNIYGPLGTWQGGREKSPAAICRKVIQSDNGSIDIWGDGKQTRSFLYIDDCIDAVRIMMNNNVPGPLNIGSEEMVTINQLVDLASKIGNKPLVKNYIHGPVGVRGRTSDNRLIEHYLGWKPKFSLEDGLSLTYKWIEEQSKYQVTK